MKSKGKKNFKKSVEEVSFNKSARREFLTGFQKRKKERQEKARKELEAQIKAEKQQIRKEIKDASNMHTI